MCPESVPQLWCLLAAGSYHEPLEDQYDWSGRGNLTKFMEMASSAGIFVNLRIGPYVCAEWTYGGLPAWLGQKDGVAFRQTNSVWQPAMEKWFNTIVSLMAKGNFFATQGGPIVLVQVENELPATDKSYVAWCGTMAQKALDAVSVNVPLTMCNGETANNTINTCNGNDCSNFLENHGQSGRILVDQPALWTENEGGFQTWGGAPPPGKEPYFWGRSMADQALSVMKWFARGGSHMNYYMWTGGNNYGRWTGDAITHMYAVDAIVCPDGHPHEPKFSHSAAMHEAIATVAEIIANSPAQLNQGAPVGAGKAVTAYTYKHGTAEAVFLENAGKESQTVTLGNSEFHVPAGSSSLLHAASGATYVQLFNSATVGAAPTTHRELKKVAIEGSWMKWQEPLLSSDLKPGMVSESSVFKSPEPMDMTNLTHYSGVDPTRLSTFAFYEAKLSAEHLIAAELTVQSFEAMGLSAFVDGKLIGTAHEITHGNGAAKTLMLPQAPDQNVSAVLSRAAAGSTLTILAEELGYANYGFKNELLKGIAVAADAVKMNGAAVTGPWTMRGGLAGEHLQVYKSGMPGAIAWMPVTGAVEPATWLKVSFSTPTGVADGAAQLHLDVSGLQRGRIWLNAHEVGRYWTLPRNDGSACPFSAKECPTQQFYHLPAAWLAKSGAKNDLVLFETLGAAKVTSVGLAVASMVTGTGPTVDVDAVVSCEY